jgi:hypothetical protein
MRRGLRDLRERGKYEMKFISTAMLVGGEIVVARVKF